MKSWIPVIAFVVSSMSCRRDPSAVPIPTRHEPPAPSAAAVLDSIDTRVPVPLLPVMANHQKQNMREHLTAVQGIVGALGAKDFDAISRAASSIGYSEQMGQMCNHMGAGAPGFTEQALRFHHTADKISAAARAHDMPGVLSALNETLATCTGCHSTFKQRVVDETTWASLVGGSEPQHH
jgi:hypothetical protein